MLRIRSRSWRPVHGTRDVTLARALSHPRDCRAVVLGSREREAASIAVQPLLEGAQVAELSMRSRIAFRAVMTPALPKTP
jgi:hypothetical protein